MHLDWRIVSKSRNWTSKETWRKQRFASGGEKPWKINLLVGASRWPSSWRTTAAISGHASSPFHDNSETAKNTPRVNTLILRVHVLFWPIIPITISTATASSLPASSRCPYASDISGRSAASFTCWRMSQFHYHSALEINFRVSQHNLSVQELFPIRSSTKKITLTPRQMLHTVITSGQHQGSTTVNITR